MNQRSANRIQKQKRILLKENTRLELEKLELRSENRELREERNALMWKRIEDAQVLGNC